MVTGPGDGAHGGEKKLSIAGMQEGMAQLLKKAGNTLALALTLSLSLVLEPYP